MAKKKMDAYVIFLSDEHLSEYVGDHDQRVAFLCGFTGSNATVIVTKEEAGLWTDGRYFIQAKKQIAGSGVKLFKSGEKKVPTTSEYLKEYLKKGMKLGYYGGSISLSEHKQLSEVAKECGAKVETKYDLFNDLWKGRPERPASSVWILEKQYAGLSAQAKIGALRNHMEEAGADAHVINSLVDIAWLMNLRGNDIPCTPVFYSYVYLTAGKCVLYMQKASLTPELKAYFKKLHVTVRDYEKIYEDLGKENVKNVLVDPEMINASLILSFKKSVKFIEKKNPTEIMKAVKNSTEVKNTKEAHIKDGVAVCKFIYALKNTLDIENMNEYEAAEVLLHLREEQEHFLEPSFETICAYGENAAQMHYTATAEKNSQLHKKGFLLVDSGGQYLEGTTDITRTIVLGELTREEKEAFTLVLKSSLRLMEAKFPDNVTGENLDVLARGIMWKEGLDYRCGTGHGVGHILNVHEGPNNFRFRLKDGMNVYPLTPGMITTDEPGLYEEGKYGIRTENELLCVKDVKTEYGQFYSFENITMVPIDLEGILPEKLTEDEKRQLNVYHATVYETISPYLTKEEAKWLKEATKSI